MIEAASTNCGTKRNCSAGVIYCAGRSYDRVFHAEATEERASRWIKSA